MENSVALSLQSRALIGSEKLGRRESGFVRFGNGVFEEKAFQTIRVGDQRSKRASIRSGIPDAKISCCCKKSTGNFLVLG